MYNDISLAVTTDIDNYDDFVIDGGSKLVNAMVEDFPDGKPFVTQRPGLTIIEDASELGATAIGRGIYYWAAGGGNFFVNGTTVYDGSYATAISGSISAGDLPVSFAEVGPNLVILDNENDEGWVIDSATKTLTEITDVDFPATLVGGGAALDGYLFVMEEDGTIWNSDLGDPTSWNALNFTSAEREEDIGIWLGKHHDHIVAIGSSSIEFFYDAAHATGSPLQRRDDIFYRIGGVEPTAVWADREIIYFFGINSSGNFIFYKIENFQLEQISTPSISAWFTSMKINSPYTLFMTGSNINGHEFLHITVMNNETSPYTPIITVVYDNKYNTWAIWSFPHGN
jgi:hypothetical protein